MSDMTPEAWGEKYRLSEGIYKSLALKLKALFGEIIAHADIDVVQVVAPRPHPRVPPVPHGAAPYADREELRLRRLGGSPQGGFPALWTRGFAVSE